MSTAPSSDPAPFMRNKLKQVRNAALREAAEIARRAPGQDWTDATTPQQMADFIAETILARMES